MQRVKRLRVAGSVRSSSGIVMRLRVAGSGKDKFGRLTMLRVAGSERHASCYVKRLHDAVRMSTAYLTVYCIFHHMTHVTFQFEKNIF